MLLDVSGLKTWFPAGGRWLGARDWIRAVDGVDLQIARGEIVGLVGESGSGKTTLGRSVLRLVEPTAGTVRFDGIDLRSLRPRKLRALRRRMQIVFQDPYASLSPRRRILEIIAEPLRLHRLVSRREVEPRVAELLERVGLEPYFMHRYPHEMSGGQRQRIAIARAFGMRPDFVVADEPVSALDVSVQAQILNLLLRLQREEGLGLLFISHDLRVIDRIADRVVVMHRGKIVEEGPAEQVIATRNTPTPGRSFPPCPAAIPSGRGSGAASLAARPLQMCRDRGERWSVALSGYRNGGRAPSSWRSTPRKAQGTRRLPPRRWRSV
jgi:ABC-type oligopeptide transport system ATPase subunit